MITDDQLRRIMPHLKADKRALYTPFLRSAMDEFAINSATRVAAFLAQLAHESGEFRWMEEIWGPTSAQRRYEPPSTLARDLGNTEAGDGKRFKGRGVIQLTGRANYQRFSRELGVDLIANPPLAAAPEVAFRVAGLYWRKNGLNELADKQWFKTITKRINGGFNGLADRVKYYERAKQVLGVAGVRGAREPETDATEPPAFPRGSDAEGGETPTAAERNATSRSARTSKSAKASAAKKAPTAKKASASKKSPSNSAARKSTKPTAKASSKKTSRAKPAKIAPRKTKVSKAKTSKAKTSRAEF